MHARLTLPYPPSANHMWVRARRGIRLSDDYAAWLALAWAHVKSQRPPKIDGAYKLSIYATRPDKRVRDIDNIIKPISDLLKKANVIRDDSDCEMVSAQWVTTGEGVTVFVELVA